ncbi:replicative DNA helicase [Porphyromonas crevioricanis]|uniref:Replicative DNA helicase n=2 Tax=Porphyromonas crevioricanis TaxID=393921 RepID=A0A2X4PLN3_9PORP|nr:replicative DNA helicase [Porphyromonas crevioricanis]GAD04725.1 replicative DNA helicase [Porphyromonas crevioricanis JCM 15906]GAD08060.1 replicative DNA helicase [Porphyromonas crevioricanis JCM 13913]SJZ78722.1 replicative DNA helicase [Porphyromonas crevioricanis]SQH72408.1 Replicative DNA helicase [Porphyromonas crevioricanis]
MPATKGKKSKLQDPVVIANPIEGRIPPQAIELEEAVLGAILLEKDAYSSVSDLLKPSTFYLKIHQLIYEAIVSLASKQKPIDLLTVTEELRRTEKLDEVGGPSYIASLTLRVAGSANLEYHAAILAQKSMSRQLISFSSKVLKNAFDDIEDIEDQMQSAEAELFEISQRNLKEEVRQINPIIKQALDEISIAANQTSGISGITSGFPAIDKMTSGWQRSDLVIIAARPAMGKTAFVLSMARNIAVDYNIPVAVFNLEMSSVQLVKRLISNVCEIPGDKIKSGRLEKYEWAQLDKKLQVLTDKPLFIDETPSLSIFELRTKARRLVREHGVQIIIIDYLQLMNASGMNVGNREQEVSMISRSLKVLAKELKIPIIALSQLNRGVETRQGDFNSKRPQLSDLRESGAIEQDADIVCFIHRPEYYKIFQDPDGNSLIGLAEFIIAKHRNGPIGDVRIRFRAEFAKFLPLEAELSTIRESAAGRTDEEAQDPLAVMGTTPLQSQDDFLSGTPLTDLPY